MARRGGTHSWHASGPTRQWQVHAFYRPSEKLSHQQLLERRQTITAEEPSLPTQAGNGYSTLRRVYYLARANAHGDERRFRAIVMQHARGVTTRHGRRRIRLAGVARPELDMEAYASAIVTMFLRAINLGDT